MATNPEAIRFWNEASNYAYLPMIATFTWQDIDSKYNLDTYDQAEAEMDQYLRDNLGYSATYDEILAAYDEVKNTSLSFWNGNYFLFDDANQYQILMITDDTVQLQVDGLFQTIPTANYSFQSSTLTFTGDISGTLTFSIPDQPDLMSSRGEWLSGLSSFQRQCAGTLMTNTASADTKAINLIGKVGCYTPIGAKNTDLCDPVDSWMGLYSVMATTTLAGGTVSSVYPDAGLTIWQDPSQQDPTDPSAPVPLVITLPTVLDGLDQSTLVLTSYRYFNNAISWDDTQLGDTAGQLMFSLQLDGTPTISGTISVDEQDWYITAYFRKPIPSPTDSPVALTALSLEAQADPTALSITTTSADLPYALIGTAYPPYALQASGGKSPYSWSNATDLPKGITLSIDGKLAGTPAVDKKGGYTVSITVTDANSQTASTDLIITIVDEVLTITTTALPDATVFDDYKVYLDATGGDPRNYQWSLATDSGQTLPSGLTFDPSGFLSGKASEASGGGAFNFKVVLTSTVSGKSLQTSKMFTLKLIAAFAPKDIFAMITACFNIFVGGGIIKMYLDYMDKQKKDAKDAKKGGADKTKAENDREDATAFLKAYNANAEEAHRMLESTRAIYAQAGKINEFNAQFGDVINRVNQAKALSDTIGQALTSLGQDEKQMTIQLGDLADKISKASGDALKELEKQQETMEKQNEQLSNQIKLKDAQLADANQRNDDLTTENKELQDTIDGASFV